VEFTIVNHPDVLEIVMSGQFTFNHNQKFKQLLPLLDTLQVRAITINLRGVEFIDSSGLGMLLLLRDECVKRDLGITLQQAQGQVEKILTISKFDQIFAT
jgi:anti-anti-sigma factor